MKKSEWIKKPYIWIDGRTTYISISFTWDLPRVKAYVRQYSLFYDKYIVGGPAVKLMPGYFKNIPDVTVGDVFDGVLQKINPKATRTTVGCIRKCSFCGVRKMEGDFCELSDWPDLPVICDNNLLASSDRHIDKVFGRLENHKDVDFNQGLDMRLLSDYHISKFKKIKSNIKNNGIKLALDDKKNTKQWDDAINRLYKGGLPKSKMATYALIGFNSDPAEAWERCNHIDAQGVMVLPMWYHTLDQLQKNIVTEDQKTLCWDDYERRKIMQWFYHHKKAGQS